jgi:hypothetical protein
MPSSVAEITPVLPTPPEKSDIATAPRVAVCPPTSMASPAEIVPALRTPPAIVPTITDAWFTLPPEAKPPTSMPSAPFPATIRPVLADTASQRRQRYQRVGAGSYTAEEYAAANACGDRAVVPDSSEKTCSVLRCAAS